MKKMMFTLIALLTIAASASAMSYEQARREALFLTDKMAYELNLSDAQYEAAYEINLDYLMGVTSQYDVFGPYCSHGSGICSVPPPISIARSSTKQATGTSASTHAIRIATISTSAARTSTTPIVEATAGA